MSEPIITGDRQLDWEEIQDYIVPVVYGRTVHREFIRKCPHRSMGDLAITYGVFGKNAKTEEQGILALTKRLMPDGITEEVLYRHAVENAEGLFPVYQSTIREALICMGVREEELFPPELPEEMKKDFFVLTNEPMKYGVAAMLYPGVLDQFCRQYPEGFYIIPSSVHEVLILSKNDVTLELATGMLRDINPTIGDDNILSDYVHAYDPVKKRIYIAEDPEIEKELDKMEQQAELKKETARKTGRTR